MPTPRTWLPRIGEITAILRYSAAEDFDRAAIERLFQVQRRAAIEIMNQAGPCRTGVSHVVSHQALLLWVEKIEQTEGQEIVRRQRLAAEIDTQAAEQQAVQKALRDAQRPILEFPVVEDVLQTTIDSLPSSIQLSPGQITLTFSPQDATEGCQLLYMLGNAIANDLVGFCMRVEKCGNVGKNVSKLVG